MIVSVVNLKGGVGKTTTALYFAEAAKGEGHTPVVIDADGEQSALEWSSQGELSFEVVAAEKDALARQARLLEKQGRVVIIDTPPNNRETLDLTVAAYRQANQCPPGIGKSRCRIVGGRRLQ